MVCNKGDKSIQNKYNNKGEDNEQTQTKQTKPNKKKEIGVMIL